MTPLQSIVGKMTSPHPNHDPNLQVTSPGFIPYMTTYIAREWKDVPLMISYHTHIPVYARTYAPWLGSFGEWISWTVTRQLHNSNAKPKPNPNTHPHPHPNPNPNRNTNPNPNRNTNPNTAQAAREWAKAKLREQAAQPA